MSSKSSASSDKCRCCDHPSVHFIELESSIKTSGGLEKTYKDILYEITNLIIPPYKEYVMPQQVCLKCSYQLKSSYKFIQQACQVSQQYLEMAYAQLSSPVDVKDIEHLQESLIEINDTVYDTKCEEGIKIEPLSIEESNTEIKKEIDEVLVAITFPRDGSQENRDFLDNENTDNSSEDDDSDEPESLNDNDDFLSNEPLARRCDVCHKVYRDEKFLKIHKRYTHMPEEDKIPCPLCNYKANRTGALRVHMGLAHGQDKVNEYFKPVLKSRKTHACSHCSRSYTRKDSLQRHIRRKHLNKNSPKEDSPKQLKAPKPREKERFLCTYCGQSFSSKGGLESHILTHTDERPFSCDICEKTFKRLKDLQLHRVIHSDEKPHQCSECGKAFKRVDKLKIHMRVHSELRPYKCSECEKTFKYQSVLRTHMHIHTGQTPFACKTCGEAFSLRTSLNNHCLKNGHVK